MASAVTEQTQGTILDASGNVAIVPTTVLSQEEAELLRRYKKFLQAHGLAEALYCKNCGIGSRNDGCEAHVTDSDILIRCRCKMRFYRGQTF